MARKQDRQGGNDWARPDPLRGRSGIVTGAGTGIGRAIAIRLAGLGADVGVGYWSSEAGARETAASIEALGRKAPLFGADLGSEPEVVKLVARATDELGPVDFLVNNAGGAGGSATDDPIDHASFTDFNRLIASNLGAAFLLSRYFAPGMLARKSGRIVNISSICGITGDCGPAYCAAKAGVLGLTRHSAVALAPYVQVNAILPGFIDSQAHDAKKVGRITPGRRMGHADDIADLTAYLIASPQTFLTGACIVADGAVTNGIIGRMMDWSEARDAASRAPG
jgi:3-oxoacyl-[acyl-carrier protein] reductase